MLVCGAVVHPYDLAAYLLTREELFADLPFEAMANALSIESPIDLAVRA